MTFVATAMMKDPPSRKDDGSLVPPRQRYRDGQVYHHPIPADDLLGTFVKYTSLYNKIFQRTLHLPKKII